MVLFRQLMQGSRSRSSSSTNTSGTANRSDGHISTTITHHTPPAGSPGHAWVHGSCHPSLTILLPRFRPPLHQLLRSEPRRIPLSLPTLSPPRSSSSSSISSASSTSSVSSATSSSSTSVDFLSDFVRFRFLLPCSRRDYKPPSRIHYSVDEAIGRLPPDDNQFPFANCHSVYYVHGLYPPFNIFPVGVFRFDTDMATTRGQFEEVFRNAIIPEMLEEVKKTGISENALNWIERNYIYNTLGGKYNRGMTVPDTYRLLIGKETLSTEEYKLSAVLGWCTELLQGMFLVADDIMDSSKTRRGNTCWYLMEGVGTIAINDSFILESSIYVLLKKYFKGTPYYIDLVELFHGVTWKTELGQLLDLLTAPEDSVDLSRFNYDKYYFIVRYKTAFYSFYLPVALAMHQAGIATPENLSRARDVLIPLGEYFQVQDDYLDCYGDPEHIGKIGTDIMDNKCGWLVNKALEKVTPEQRKLLEENYGQKDATAEKRVKELYFELNLEEDYKQYEAKSIALVRELISKVDESQGLKRSVLEGFLNKIAGRSR